MRRIFAISALCLAWLFANGAAWNLVQVVAWAKMFRDYSQVSPVREALRETLEGAPCKLCRLAQDGAKTAREQLPKSDAFGAGDRLVLAWQPVPPVVLIAPNAVWPGLVHEAGRIRTDAVPVPPPRA